MIGKPHTEHVPHTSEVPASSTVAVDPRMRALGLKAKIARRARMKLGHLTDDAVAAATHTHRTTVCRWRDKDREDAPSLRHMVDAQSELLDEWLSALAVERTKLGYPPRRWIATSECVDELAPELDAALKRASSAADDLAEVITKMRGVRGVR